MSEIEEAIKCRIDAAVAHATRFDALVPPEGYEYGWARYVFGGYSNNYSPERDIENLNNLAGKGWQPVTASPHPDIQLSQHGFVLNGDLVLIIRPIAKELEWQEVVALEYDAGREEKVVSSDVAEYLKDAPGREGLAEVFGDYPKFDPNSCLCDDLLVLKISRQRLYDNLEDICAEFPEIFTPYIPILDRKEGERIWDVRDGFYDVQDLSNMVYIIKRSPKCQ